MAPSGGIGAEPVRMSEPANTSTAASEVRPSGMVSMWWTISPRRIMPMTLAIEAWGANSYSPAFRWRAAPLIWAVMMKMVDEPMAWSRFRVDAISGRLAPGRRVTLVGGPLWGAG